MSDHTPLDKAKGALEAARDKEALGLERRELLQIAVAQATVDAAETLRRVEKLLIAQRPTTPRRSAK